MQLRKPLLGACLALSLAGFGAVAHAQAPQQERVIHVPAGAVVLVLPGATDVTAPIAAPAPFGVDFPAVRMIAAQDAMLQHLMHQMQVLDQLMLPLPDPTQAIRSVKDGMPEPGRGVVTTMVSDGRGVCRHTITYSKAVGEKPVVHVAQSGDACGPLHVQGPVQVQQTVPDSPGIATHRVPAVKPAGPRLWTVGDPPHPSVPRT